MGDRLQIVSRFATRSSNCLFTSRYVCVCVCVSGIPAFLCVLVSVPLYLYDDA